MGMVSPSCWCGQREQAGKKSAAAWEKLCGEYGGRDLRIGRNCLPSHVPGEARVSQFYCYVAGINDAAWPIYRTRLKPIINRAGQLRTACVQW